MLDHPSVDESARLEALSSYEVLDTPPDPRVDVFVRLAAQVFDVPISLVTLVDSDRQWFKAAHGLDGRRETPRDIAFCHHAIRTPDQVMVVEDATRDTRFAANPLVTGNPGIRFYAGAPLTDRDGSAIGTLCIIDRTPRTLDEAGRKRLADLAMGVSSALDLHRSNARLQHAATHDPLTGLANRSLFGPRLESAALAACAPGAESPCGVLSIDLDRLKALNDRLGHAGGDQVLRTAAERIQGAVRTGDLVARLGGDEFAVLLAAPLTPDTPLRVSERILEAFAEPILVDGREVVFGASIGHAMAPLHGKDGKSLLRASDKALYRAKLQGRGRAVGCQDATSREARPRSLRADLRAAVSRGEFFLVWQPYFATATGALRGHEALLRWIRPGHGAVPPDMFIPLAEQYGLIGRLDAWVLEAACRQTAGIPGETGVSVNITPSTFCSPDFTRLVGSTLARTGLAAHRLVLEITERMALERPDVGGNQIEALRRIGVRVALDDFGVGYSALSCLKEFAFDTVKLDRTFIQDIGRNGRAESIIRSVVQLGRNLGTTVCAEGVETAMQLDFLRDAGCDLVQGYLLGAPDSNRSRSGIARCASYSAATAAPDSSVSSASTPPSTRCSSGEAPSRRQSSLLATSP